MKKIVMVVFFYAAQHNAENSAALFITPLFCLASLFGWGTVVGTSITVQL
jgi:hypothetical protein